MKATMNMKATVNMKASKGLIAGFWISTVLFALEMGFTAYAQLRLPQVAALSCATGSPAISGLSFHGRSSRA